ncbi:MAG: ABC transporter permease [Meiothermus sp.]|nr:ABC transporter permease [Meiothermus sp.]
MRLFLALMRVRFLGLTMSDGLVWLVLSSVLFPFILLFFVSHLAPNQVVQTRLLAGAITASAVLNSIFLFGQAFAAQRARGEYELYSTWPIGKLTFILGTLATNLLVNLLSAFLLLALAVQIFSFKVVLSLLLVPVLVLGALAVAGIGLVVGILSRGPGEAAIVSNFLVYVLSYATPVFFPLQNLPQAVQYGVWALPTTHAALSVQAVLTGKPPDLSSLLVLLLWAGGLLGFVVYRMDWRLRA